MGPLVSSKAETAGFHSFSSSLKQYPWVIALIKLGAVKQLGK